MTSDPPPSCGHQTEQALHRGRRAGCRTGRVVDGALGRLLAAVSAGALVLTACGGDGQEPDTAATAGSGTADGPVEGDGALVIGTLLPQTGNVAVFAPPLFAAVELAVREVNSAGGVLGGPVQLVEGDSGDSQQDIANPTVDRLLAADVDVIIGATSSGVSFSVIDKITSAGVVHYSPANTSPEFTDYEDGGLYFRTAPSDVLQGRILGETMLADGCTEVGVLALQDPYGEGLAENVGLAVTRGGGALTPEQPVYYDPATSNFDAQVNALRAANPGCIVLIGFEESAEAISAMVGAGIGPQQTPLYLTDGNTSSGLGADLPPGTLEGTKGVLPGAEATPDFRERLLGVDPELEGFSYAAETYDAIITSALAAVAAGSDAGKAVAAELPDVTRVGTRCRGFADCKELLEDGEDIDYDGSSGPIELSDKGDPTSVIVGVYTFGADNELLDEVDYQPGELEE